jgi:hypothetical protein
LTGNPNQIIARSRVDLSATLSGEKGRKYKVRKLEVENAFKFKNENVPLNADMVCSLVLLGMKWGTMDAT